MTTANPSKHTSSSKSSKKRSAHKVHTLPLATMAALLTAATCLGSQPAMAVPATAIPTTTYKATARSLTNSAVSKYQDREYVPLGEKKPWLQHPNILEFRRLRGVNSNATEIKSDVEGSDNNWKAVNDKTAMYAHVETRGDSDYLIFDVFFNNNAKSMISKSDRQWYLWQVPYAIADLDSNGLYKSDTVTNLRYDAYRPKKEGHILSQDPEAFEKDDSLSFSVSDMRKKDVHFGKDGYALYQVGIGLNPGNKVYDDLDQIFHKNSNESLISRMAGDQTTYAFHNPQYNKNYGLGITVAKPYDNVAYHMHAELKLRPGAINKNADNYNDKYANIQNAWTWANSGSYGATTNSAYTVISGRDPENDEDKDGKLGRNKTDSEAPKIYYNGTEIANKTKTKTIKLKEGDKLSFTTTDDKGYIEKFSISGLTDTPITKQGAGSKDKPLSSGEITVTNDMNGKEVTITSEDGSGNVTTRKVKVTVKKKTLADEHPLTGKTIDTTVGEPLPKLTELVEIKDGDKLDKQPTLKWNGTATPNTDKVGVFTPSIKGEYSDKSKSFTNVTINVKPQKPVIDTDLTNLAGKKGQKVTVSVGSGIPTDDKVTTTVKLFDKNGKEIGSTTTINGGKAEITVKDGMPEGDVYATTTVKKPDETSPKGTTKGFNLTSEKSATKQATAPKDAQDPTITATADSSSVTVGQDLKIHIVAKDDVKVEKINYIDALMGANLLQQADIVGGRASVLPETTNTDQKKVLDLTVTKMQPKEVGTHTLTLTVTDSAGKTGSTTLTITVKPKAPTVTVPADGKDQGSATITPADGTDTLVITYTPEGENATKTITVKKGSDNKWKIDGNTPTGVKVDENTGKVTIPADKVKDNSDVTAVDKKGDTSSDSATGNAGKNPAAPATKPAAPAVEPQNDGSVNVTPADGTDTLVITYTPEGENATKTITVKKGSDNKWKIDGNTPTGVKVDENTGKVTIPADKVKDNSDVTAVDKKGDTSSDSATGNAGKNPAAPATKPAAPAVEPQNDGSVNVTPADGTDTLEITYTPEGENATKTITVKKGSDNKWKIDGNTPTGVKVDENTGKVTIPADKVKDNSDVTAVDKKGDTSSDSATGNAGKNPAAPATKPAAPAVEPQNDGSVNVTPADGTDTLEITYTPEGENATKTITVKKGSDNKWKIDGNTPTGVKVDENTGKVTIPADKVKDNSDVTAVDKKGDTSSDSATGNAGKNPAAPATKPAAPAVEPQNDGSVNVTPADGTDTLEITYTPEGENATKTITVKKGSDNKWKIDGNTPTGVKVDENTGKVTIPADKVKDNSDVTAVDKKGDTSSDSATGNAGKNPAAPATKPAAPAVEPQNDGSVNVTPADGTDTLVITYTPEGENATKTITVKKGSDNKWKIDGNTPTGVKVDENTGKVTIPADKVKDNSDVTAVDKKGDTSSDSATGNAGKNPAAPATKPAAPAVEPQNDGSVNVTPADGTDTLVITYTPEGENATKTITVKKGSDNKWKIDGNTPTGVKVDENTGKVTIPADKVKDNSDVTAVDKKGENTSSEATGKAGSNDGNSGSGTGSDSGSGDSGSGSETGNSNGSGSGSGDDSTSNNAGNAETGNAGNGKADNASTGASGSNASTKSGNKVPAKHSSQLVKTGAEVERVGLISAMIGVLGAAAAFFSRKKNRE